VGTARIHWRLPRRDVICEWRDATLHVPHPAAIREAAWIGFKNREKTMSHGRQVAAACIATALLLALCGSATAAKSEIKGEAILDHPCGKVSVKQMGLAHAGKMEEANKLTTKEMQDQWKAMPAKDREMMSGMMKDMSSTEQDFANDVKANGLLAVDGQDATLTVKKTTKDKNGSSTSTMTQKFRMDGNQCLISR
jgi:hypothetical protein